MHLRFVNVRGFWCGAFEHVLDLAWCILDISVRAQLWLGVLFVISLNVRGVWLGAVFFCCCDV